MTSRSLIAGVAWMAARSPEAGQAARVLPLVISGVITYVFLSQVSAGVALYSIANSVVGMVEQSIARHTLHDGDA
jgi:membrane protein insertase Oxa1/YidC/SpoIIIJ